MIAPLCHCVPHRTGCQGTRLWVRLVLGSLRHGHWVQRKVAQPLSRHGSSGKDNSGEVTPQEMRGNSPSPGSWTRESLR